MRILITLVSLSLLCNCLLGIYIHRLYGTINNLKTSLNITNDRITELETKPNVNIIRSYPENKPVNYSSDIIRLKKQVEEANDNAFYAEMRAEEAYRKTNPSYMDKWVKQHDTSFKFDYP